MTTYNPSRSTNRSPGSKKRNRKVRVLAVFHPPEGAVNQSDLDGDTPYLTDDAVSGWVSDRRCANTEEVADQIAFASAIAMGALGKDLMAGAYRGTLHNPLFAIEIFTTHHAMGLYPPLWVLDWLNEAFAEFLESEGESDLLGLLGVKRGKGKRTIFDEARAVNIETGLMHEISLLNALGVSIVDAATMVEARNAVLGRAIVSADTLAERFTKRHWRGYADLIKEALANLSHDELIGEFKKQYPAEHLPAKWR
jgi:hypothetical protein